MCIIIIIIISSRVPTHIISTHDSLFARRHARRVCMNIIHFFTRTHDERAQKTDSKRENEKKNIVMFAVARKKKPYVRARPWR